MLRLSLALAAAALLTAPVDAAATKCRNAKGQFTPCPAASAGPKASDIVKDNKGKCHWKAGPNKGKFVKCP